jgi:adenylate cyclase
MSARRPLLVLVVALVAIGVAGLFRATGALESLELRSVDARFELRGAQEPSEDIVIVGLETVDAYGPPMLDRNRHAKVIEELTKAGAGVIAYGFQFTSESADVDADNALIEAIAASPKVVLGTADVEPNGEIGIFGGADGLDYSGATPGDTRFLDNEEGEDAPGVRIRRMPFALSPLRPFSLAAADLYRGRRVATPAGQDEAWIDFAGRPGTYPVLDFADVERGNFDRAAVRGKLVVVGATGERANDRLATATSGKDLMARAEVEAAAIDTALRGFPLHEPAPWVDTLLALALALVVPLMALRFRALVAVAVGLGLILAYLIAAQLAFNAGVVLAVVPVVAGIVTGLLGVVLLSRPQDSPAINRVLDRLTPKGGNQRTRRLRALLLVSAAFSVVTVGLLASAGNVLRNVDLSTVDYRFAVRGEQPPPPEVVVVAIDAATLNDDPKPTLPLPRDMYTRVVRNLTAAGASVIALDVQLTEPGPEKKLDAELVEAISKAPKVVLSTTETDGGGGTSLLPFGDGLAYSRGIPGITVVIKDADGRVRHMLFDKQRLTSFPLAAAEAKLGRPIDRPEGRTAWIDYPGPSLTVPYISFRDVERNEFRPEAVRGKVAIVGGTATSLQDQHNTSTTRNFLMAGPEIQANSVATALAGFPLHDVAWWVNALLIVAVGVAAPLAGLRFGLGVAVGIGLAVVAVFLVGAQLAFQEWDAIVTVIYPFAAGIAGVLLTAAIHGLTVAFEREQARDAFARFVPEAVVDQVLADAEGVRLGGVRGEATVMFSDLRGFTSFSETLEPERVIESLNRYLTEMSEAILDHGGTLVAYMGDGIMAVFGAPLKQDDHADRALEAARDMLSRMAAFNGWLREQELHDGFKMGIGLNSGPVMSGNVGSERRLEYTALGDTTNTAARLEGMTKGTPFQLYISDTTKQKLTRAPDDLVQVGEAEVRGRKAKVLLWSLRNGDAPPHPSSPSEAVEA